MSDVDEKLRRGFELIERSRGDSDLLGTALLAIHGALEDYFRQTLLARTDLSPADRALLDERVGWVTLVTLMQKYGGLSREQRRAILEANELRQSFAHGEPFYGRVSSLLRYGRFVETICGRRGLLDQVLIEQRQTRASRATVWTDEEPMPRARQPAARSGIPLGRFVAIATVILALLLGTWLYTQRESFLGALGLIAPVATPYSTIQIPPTPTPQRARVVHLGGGPGWLHETPSFASGTLPIPLSEGMEVTLLDEEQTDSGGHVWGKVSVGGYEGWCPANNLEKK